MNCIAVIGRVRSGFAEFGAGHARRAQGHLDNVVYHTLSNTTYSGSSGK